MKKILLITTGFLITSLSFAQTLTLDEVIGKYVEAIGGKDVLSQVKTIYVENTAEVMGSSLTQKEILVEGKAYKTEADFNGTNIINCITDKGGWMVNPMMGSSDAQPLSDEIYRAGKAQIYHGGILIDYSSKGYKASLEGLKNGNYIIKVSSYGIETTYFIDQKTFLLNKTIAKGEVMGQSVDVTVTYSDYKKTDIGLVYPYAKNIDMGMFQIGQTVSKIEINKEFDPQIFEMPK